MAGPRMRGETQRVSSLLVSGLGKTREIRTVVMMAMPMKNSLVKLLMYAVFS